MYYSVVRRRKNLSDAEIARIWDEIPSDEESVIDDSDADDPDYAEEVPDIIDADDDDDVNEDDAGNETETDSNVPGPSETNFVPPTWSKNYSAINYNEFTEESGPSECITNIENPSPVDIFNHIFTDNLINHIVFHTNLYATQAGGKFTPTIPKEICTFLGINLLMGIKKLPCYRDYWSSAPELHDSYISSLMTVNRFGWLLNHIHLNDNAVIPKKGTDGYDKLYKLRPMLNMLSDSFLKCFIPGKFLAIDESMVKYKGRSTLKQYMKDKPIKRGYKIWMLCDESSYNLKFEIYTGKIDNIVQKDLGASVILRLSQGLENKNHHLYFDNYFNSYKLMTNLQQKGIYACGTVQPNRKHLPKLASDKQLKRGEFDWQVSDSGVTFMKWKDNRAVHLLSNYHSPLDVVKVTRKEKIGSKIEVSCPQALRDYNSHMNNVDKFDQLKKSYEIDRRSRKWWPRIFYHLLDCSVVNSYIIWKSLENADKMDSKTFRRSIVTSLVSQALVSTLSTVRSPKTQTQIKKHKPFVAKDVRTQSSEHQPERSTARRCAKCSTTHKQVRTMWICSVCRVPLCLGKTKTCFQDFHK